MNNDPPVADRKTWTEFEKFQTRAPPPRHPAITNRHERRKRAALAAKGKRK